MATDYKHLGSYIAASRRSARLSQVELATRAKVAVSTLTKIERGAIREPSIFTIARIAQVLGMSLDKLVRQNDGQSRASKSHEISFIYFDIHGVVATNWERTFTELASRFHLEPQAIEWVFWRYNDIVGRGHMTLVEFEKALARDLHLTVKQVPYVDIYFETVKGDPRVHELMRELSQHYQIGLFSNIFPGFLDKLIAMGVVPTLPYGAKIESCVVGAVKPETAIYEYAQAQANTPANRLLLIDDIRSNIDTARQLGWQGSWFDDQHPAQSVTKLSSRLLPG